jgi:hypothetical protein
MTFKSTFTSPFTSRLISTFTSRFTSTFLSRRTWRRLERGALRGHDRDLQRHLRELAERRPAVLSADGSWMSGVMSLQLSGHRLMLGGVHPSMAWDVRALSLSPDPIKLTRAGRYGPFWWIALASEEAAERERVVLATHLQLRHDPGPSQETEVHLPVLSGAS